MKLSELVINELISMYVNKEDIKSIELINNGNGTIRIKLKNIWYYTYRNKIIKDKLQKSSPSVIYKTNKF
jgi:hypothetical protein